MDGPDCFRHDVATLCAAVRSQMLTYLVQQGASSSEASAVRDVAGLTVVDFARFQDIVQFDLADSPAITQLKGDSQYGALYTLMGVLLAGDVQVKATSLIALSLLLAIRSLANLQSPS